MLIKKLIFITAFAALMCVSTAIQAVMISGDGVQIFPTSGDSLEPGMTESTDLQVFFEGDKSSAGTDVDVLASALPAGAYTVDDPSDRSVGSLSGPIRSWYLHFDGPGTSLTEVTDVSLTFSTEIIGLIFSDDKPVWAGDNYLADSLPTYGLSGVTYATSLNGPNFDLTNPFGDSVTLSSDRMTLTVDSFATTTGIDEMRVLLVTPEPSTYLVAGSGLLIALIAYRHKKRKAKV